MRHTIILLTVSFATVFQSCNGQKDTKDILLGELTFSSIFGESKKDSLHTYCLLGTGYFRTPRSDNSDSLITFWLTQHPQAKVISVATHGPTMTDYPNSKMTYCWLVDDKDTINNYLIKNGCFPGGTMMRPDTYDEMSNEMKEIYKDIPKPNVIVHIDKKSYDNFIEQVKVAETYPKQNKLGVWKKKADEE
jgi:hypothetical protein